MFKVPKLIETDSCCCSVGKSYQTLCDPMDSSILGSLSFTISQTLLKLMSIESMMSSNSIMLSFNWTTHQCIVQLELTIISIK